MEQELVGIWNAPVDTVKLHILNDEDNLEDLKRSFHGMNPRQRGQHMGPIITTVIDAVDDRAGGGGIKAEKVALYSVSRLEEAYAAVVNPRDGDRLNAVRANLTIASTAAAAINKNALRSITYYKWFRFVGHFIFFMLLSALTWYLLANLGETWKEIAAALVPQLYTLIFNLVELRYKVQVAEYEINLGVSNVVVRGCVLVERLLEIV